MNNTKIAEFWNWFIANEHTFYYGTEEDTLREELFVELDAKIKEISEDLAFEFSPILEGEVKQFTLSADGIRDVFPSVISLIEQAPKHPHWEFVAFRQRIDTEDLTIQMGDVEMDVSDIYFRFAEVDDTLGIELNIRGFEDSDQEKMAVFILLDSLIGEYDVVMQIGWIEWVALDERKIGQLSTFVKLRDLVDKRKESGLYNHN
ncbi:MAG: hypothetical protein R3E32_13360 [Chitinophagales bacterium]